MSHPRAELIGDPTAGSARGGGTPGDDGAIGLERREGVGRGVDLNDARAELYGHPTAIAALFGVAPGDNGAIGLERREGAASGYDLGDCGA